jgi:SSS family solute:Na+ symporter
LDQFNAIVAPIHDKHGFLFTFWNIPWLYYCQILFVGTAVLMIVISLCTEAPDPKTIKYTWYGATPEEKAATRASWGTTDVVLSAVVIALVIVFYIKFW